MLDSTGGKTAGDDISGLLLPGNPDRSARNAAETEAIYQAYDKFVFMVRPKKPGSGWMTEGLVRVIHKEMFGSIWDWAGRYRDKDVNIGVPWHDVPEEIGRLCGDFQYWDSSPMPVLETAARLQNRLTRIHPFANGNGRMARLLTDIFLKSRGHRLPVWPQVHLLPQGDGIRRRYISAMKSADGEDYVPLIDFIKECCDSEG